MNDEKLNELKRSAMHFYSGMTCQKAEVVLLPLWKYTATVWAKAEAGPGKLDEIFFQLLRNGVNTRQEIAARLGVDKDEFIFAHLDILTREGYVSESAGEYKLSEKGEQFCGGGFKEEQLQRCEFSFVWNDISGRIDSKYGSGAPKKGRKLSHAQPPSEDDLLASLSDYFNAVKGEKGLVFYDIDYSIPGKGLRWEKKHKEHAALFYTPSKGQGGVDNWRVDLRTLSDNGQFVPCNTMTDEVNKNEHWRGQFDKMFNDATRR